MGYLLGIDAGTTRTKAALVDPEKGMVACVSTDCSVPCSHESIAEVDMDMYWRACVDCLKRLSGEAKVRLGEVEALAIASQGVTFVPVDGLGRDLGRGILVFDTRAKEEARELVDHFGRSRLYEITGQPSVSALYEAAKLLWIRKHQPERFRKIHKVLLVQDYLAYRLTGGFAAVTSLLSSSVLFDLTERSWWPAMLQYIGLSPERLPRVCRHGQCVGTVTEEASRLTGLSRKTKVVAGAIDQIGGMIGLGHIAPGMISESTGTVLAVHTVSDRLFPNEEKGVLNFCGALEDTYAWITVCPTGGMALDWFQRHFAAEEKRIEQCEGASVFDQLTAQAQRVAPGAEGLVMLPYLAGRGGPAPHPGAKGALYGFGLHHGKEHFVRALMESIAYLLRSNIEILRCDGEVREIRSFGGGSRNTLWNQIKADVCGLPVVTSACREPGCLGAAILAGVGAGIYESVETGCRQLVSLADPQPPDAANHARYEEGYGRYVALDTAMEPMFRENG